MNDHQNEMGVYYRKCDHPGFFRRLAMSIVDVFCVFLVSCLIALLFGEIAPAGSADIAFVMSIILLGFVYFVLLKRSRLRTLGFRLFRSRVVNLHGDQPSIFQMLSRFAFAVGGPLNVVADLICIPSDENRQAFRDKLAQTYVVSHEATPVGLGRIVMRRVELMGWSFLFAEVLRGREE